MANPGQGKVLLVDNHPVVLKYVSGLLEKNGYRVKTAGEKAIPISLSIGIASARPGESSTPENLLSIPDSALYKAKKAGKNQMIHRELETGHTGPNTGSSESRSD